jgi:hypothetical protein
MKSDLLLEKEVALKDIEANLNQKSAYAVILSNSLNEQQKMLTLLQEQIETQSLDHQLLLQNEQQKVSRLQKSLEGALYQYEVLKKNHAEEQAYIIYRLNSCVELLMQQTRHLSFMNLSLEKHTRITKK